MTRCLALLAVALPALLVAQDSTQVVTATDLTIPSSPAFVLLDVNPANVTRPGFTKDFKLDLLVKDGNILSNLAIEAKPIWILLYSDVDLPAYQGRGDLERALSTLSVSVGTAEKNDQKKLAWSAKMTLLRKDPLLDQSYISSVGDVLNISKEEAQLRIGMQVRISQIERERRKVIKEINALSGDSSTNAAKLEELEARRDSLQSCKTSEERTFEKQVGELQSSKSERLKAVTRAYSQKHWNADAVDIGFGELYTYDSSTIDSLKLKNQGFGVWLSFGTGLGTRNWLLCGLLKGIEIDDRLSQLYGVNIRYGGSTIDFFAEFIYEKNDQIKKYTLAYGGEYRLDANRSIEFGLRTGLDKNVNLRSLTPVVKLNWNFGENPLK
jgi:hypothetical protein